MSRHFGQNVRGWLERNRQRRVAFLDFFRVLFHRSVIRHGSRKNRDGTICNPLHDGLVHFFRRAHINAFHASGNFQIHGTAYKNDLRTAQRCCFRYGVTHLPG